jgi:predicted nucleic acid-binding protein
VTVVCNATPLINFAAINRLDILKATFDQIVIPQAVCDETTVIGFPASELILQAIAANWLQVRPVSTIAPNIPPELDDGEREAIALALLTSELQILFDERAARQVAQSLGLQVIGTSDILLLAKNRGIITQVKPVLDAMINHAQYWVSRPLYEQVLRQARELNE